MAHEVSNRSPRRADRHGLQHRPIERSLSRRQEVELSSDSATFFPSRIVSRSARFRGELPDRDMIPEQREPAGGPIKGPRLTPLRSPQGAVSSPAPRLHAPGIVRSSVDRMGLALRGRGIGRTGARRRTVQGAFGRVRRGAGEGEDDVRPGVEDVSEQPEQRPEFDESSWISSRTTRQSPDSEPTRSSRSQAVFMGWREVGTGTSPRAEPRGFRPAWPHAA